MVPGVRSAHVNPISTGTITNTGISHTITGTCSHQLFMYYNYCGSNVILYLYTAILPF